MWLCSTAVALAASVAVTVSARAPVVPMCQDTAQVSANP